MATNPFRPSAEHVDMRAELLAVGDTVMLPGAAALRIVFTWPISEHELHGFLTDDGIERRLPNDHPVRVVRFPLSVAGEGTGGG